MASSMLRSDTDGKQEPKDSSPKRSSKSESDDSSDGGEEEAAETAPWRALFFFTTKQHVPLLSFSIFLSLISGIVDPAQAFLIGKVFGTFTSYGSGEIDNTEFFRREKQYILYLLIVACGDWIITGVDFFCWLCFGELQAKSARDRLFHGLMDKEIAWYDMRKNGIGALLPRLQAQIRELQLGCSQPLSGMFAQTSISTLSLIQAFMISWDLTLVTIATVPIFMGGVIWAGSSVQKNIEHQQGKLTEAQKYTTNALSNIETVKCYNGQEAEKTKYNDKIGEAAAWYYHVASANAIQMGLIVMLSVSMFVQGFYYGGVLINRGTLKPENVITAFLAAMNAFQAINSILPQLLVLEKGRTAGAVLRRVMNEVYQGSVVQRSKGIIKPMECHGAIEVKNLTFSYPSRPELLAVEDVSMFIPGGDLTFLIGKSGSGKSTLGQLLMRFYTSSQGHIAVDGTPLEELDATWLRSNITLVEQTSLLFNDTMFRNIALGRKDFESVTREEAMEAAEFALLQFMINDMPNGLDTLVGYKGGTMSGGQRQRMALARARLRDTPILLLDESTSALDRISRALMMDAIRLWRKGKTTIIITHDISQILGDDYVYVLDQGKLVQDGYRRHLEQMPNTPFQAFLPLDPQVREEGVEHSEIGDSESIRTRGSSVDADEHLLLPMKYDRLEAQLAASEYERASFVPQVFKDGTPLAGIRVNAPVGPATAMMKPWSKLLTLPGQEPYEIANPRWSGWWPVKEERKSAIISTDSKRATKNMETLVDKTGQLAAESRLVPSGIERRRIKHGDVEKVSEKGESGDHHPGDSTTQEEQEGPQDVDARPLKSILATLRPTLSWDSRSALIIGFWGASVHAVASPVFSYVLSLLFQTYAKTEDTSKETLIYSLVILGIAVVDALHTYIFRFFLEYTGQRWVDGLRAESLQRVLDQPRAFFDKEENAVSRITLNLDRNAEETRNLLGRFVAMIYIAVLMTAVALVWCIAAQWKMTLIALCAAPYILGTAKAFATVSEKWESRCNAVAEDAGAIFNETFTNIKTVRALTLEKHFLAKYLEATDYALKIGFRRCFWSGFFCGWAQSGGNFAIAMVFYVGAVLVKDGASMGDVIQVFTLLIFTIAQLDSILGYIPQMGMSKDTAARLLRLAELPKDSHEHLGSTRITTVGDIVFDDLHFTYPTRPDQTVLSSLRLHIKPGTCTAIVGGSGSGKSTIANLLLNLYGTPTPTHSTPASKPNDLTFSGRDIKRIHTPSLRALIVPVSQTPTLFPATVAENITYGLPDSSPYATQAAAKAAAEEAGIHDFIASLPQGYATPIGEGGSGLSGGQAQRIAIARALVRRPAVLILDEATSALDVESAALVRTTLERLVRERGRGLTVVVITHAREMMEVAERVVVLDQGRVVEVGGFEELVARRGALAHLLSGGEWTGEGEDEG